MTDSKMWHELVLRNLELAPTLRRFAPTGILTFEELLADLREMLPWFDEEA